MNHTLGDAFHSAAAAWAAAASEASTAPKATHSPRRSMRNNSRPKFILNRLETTLRGVDAVRSMRFKTEWRCSRDCPENRTRLPVIEHTQNASGNQNQARGMMKRGRYHDV